jgi:hypothetical protein
VQPFEQHHGDEGCPNLDAKGVLGGADEGLDLEVLLEHLEEELDLPALFVDGGDGGGPEARIAKMKDGTTHLAYKPEHAIDLDTGAVIADDLHPADEGDTTTLSKTLESADDPVELITDKGYHSRAVVKDLEDSPWKTRISEPKRKSFSRWHGDEDARRAVINNRSRLLSGVARVGLQTARLTLRTIVRPHT